MPVDNFLDTAFPRQISRRSVLRGTVALAALGAIAAIAGPLPAAAADATQQDFMQLSTFLTGHHLDPVLGSRYFAALQKRSRSRRANECARFGHQEEQCCQYGCIS